MAKDIGDWVEDDCGGLVGASDLADELEVDVRVVRQYAASNDLPVIGRSYVFTPEDAADLEEEIFEDEEEEEEEEDLDEDEDGDEPGVRATIECNEEDR